MLISQRPFYMWTIFLDCLVPLIFIWELFFWIACILQWCTAEGMINHPAQSDFLLFYFGCSFLEPVGQEAANLPTLRMRRWCTQMLQVYQIDLQDPRKETGMVILSRSHLLTNSGSCSGGMIRATCLLAMIYWGEQWKPTHHMFWSLAVHITLP